MQTMKEDSRQENAGRRVIVSGGSGMLGTALRQALAASSTAVLQLVRNGRAGVGQIAWDPGVGVTDAAALEGCVAAIHLSGASIAGHRWTSEYRRELEASRVDSTRTLATVLAGLRRPPETLIVASAVGIFGDRGDEMLDESSASGSGFLAELCCAWEAAAQPANDAGIRVVHSRFGVVLGNGPGALSKMLPAFRVGLGGRLGTGRQWMSWISLADAVGALLFALDAHELAGAVDTTAPCPVTNLEFTRALAGQLGRPAVLSVPALALRIALGSMANEVLLASQRALPSKLLAAGFEFQHATIGQALAASLG